MTIIEGADRMTATVSGDNAVANDYANEFSEENDRGLLSKRLGHPATAFVGDAFSDPSLALALCGSLQRPQWFLATEGR